jgi:integrase
VEGDTGLLEPTQDLEGIKGRAEHSVELWRDHHVAGPQDGQQPRTLGSVAEGLGSRDAAFNEYSVDHQALHGRIAGDHALLDVEALALVGLLDGRDAGVAVDVAGGGRGGSLPGSPAMVCGYITTLAHGGLKASTLGRRIAAIAHAHSQHGHKPPPTADETVRVVMKGIRRTIGTARAGKAPATADLLMQMLALCPDSMIGRRDRALLALGFAGAFRRSELCALQVDDLVEVPDGLRVVIRRSKTDQTGEGQEVAIPRGYRLRPVEAVQTWLAAADISSGPVFRAVALGGKVSDEGLADDSAARIVKRYARRVGLDPASYAGHSLRSGFLTSAAESGASIWKLSEVSRHKSLDTLRGYVRRVDLFKEHAGAAFL